MKTIAIGESTLDKESTSYRPVWGQGRHVGVYGVVALIVKMDDIGLHLAERRAAFTRAVGRGLVKSMPVLMRFLSTVGTAAMIWVGGGLLVHGLEVLGFATIAHFIHDVAEQVGHALSSLESLAAWVVTATLSGLFGLAIGGAIAFIVHKIRHRGHAAH